MICDDYLVILEDVLGKLGDGKIQIQKTGDFYESLANKFNLSKNVQTVEIYSTDLNFEEITKGTEIISQDQLGPNQIKTSFKKKVKDWKEIDFVDLQHVDHLTPIEITLIPLEDEDDDIDYTVRGFVWQGTDGRTYVIQDLLQGLEAPGNWHDYGEYSWVVSGRGDYNSDMPIKIPKDAVLGPKGTLTKYKSDYLLYSFKTANKITLYFNDKYKVVLSQNMQSKYSNF